jgi:ribosomal protein S18 acetylase RimI-like enzyme
MIEELKKGQGFRLRAIRLRALAEAPQAFATTLEEAQDWGLESWEFQIEKLQTFIWREGEADLGMVRGVTHDCDPEAGYLISMWVAPEARLRGIGAALVDEVIEWARRRGFRRLVLDVGESNVGARALYENRGFVVTGTTRALPPPREHVKELEMQIEL